VPWRTIGPEGELRLAESGLTVRCLVAPDGSLPLDTPDAELIAVVGKAY
jgi:prolyl-tRNA synthetase